MRLTFNSPKPRRLGKTIYNELHERLRTERNRRLWAILLLVLWAVVIIALLLLWQTILPPAENLYLSVVASSLLICVLVLLRFSAENLYRSDEESKYISIAFDFLYEHNIFSRSQIGTLDKRAEIGMGAGQLRTLFPLLALPLAIPIAIQVVQIVFVPQSTVSVYSVIYLGAGLLVVLFMLFSFFQEIDRSNRDAIIRHAIAEYTNPATFQVLQEQRDQEAVKRIVNQQRVRKL